MSVFEEKKKSFLDLTSRMKQYQEAVGIMYWDLRTGAPKKGVAKRSEAIGLLSTEIFKLSISDEMVGYLTYFEQEENAKQVDPITKRLVEILRKEYDRSAKIPAERYQEYVVLTSQAESAWEEAKNADDYSKFSPYLEKIIAFNREFVEIWGYEEHPYNALLDQFEPGMTVAKLDQVFGALREKLVPLVHGVQESSHKPKTDFMFTSYPVEKQKTFNRFILEQLGYDFDAGRVDETEHPFASGFNLGDVRITTHYKENHFSDALFSTIHECGHALYEQNVMQELDGTLLCSGTSMGIHESQSRFWENMIGRSRFFWDRYFTDLKKQFPEQLDGVTEEAFYVALNEAKPSLIRTESDELTYNLHIMIRYELEKDIISGKVTVDELPALWNAKYEEYLGVTPPNNKLGILQDVHWAGGSFGYFPSYALGNMYAAQFERALRKDLPNLDELVQAGDFAPIKQWLTDKIYQYGMLKTPGELITGITGEELNPDYLVHYLTKKYSDIYKLV
ncbi:carboxypeptidase M32 [Gorillibacterium sp. CAU 1737]|uniref:carboxypeptidase M32 n=1 Tax=Gorillibacterium sp. CAU 1737 TaxID=3140362 RepID=UPI00326012DA